MLPRVRIAMYETEEESKYKREKIMLIVKLHHCNLNPTYLTRWRTSAKHGPALISDFYPELSENTFLLCQATQCVVICYGSHRRWIHPPCPKSRNSGTINLGLTPRSSSSRAHPFSHCLVSQLPVTVVQTKGVDWSRHPPHCSTAQMATIISL